jgi:hypothetical protein
MKNKIFGLAIILLLILQQSAKSDIVPSITYKTFENTNNMLISLDLKATRTIEGIGTFDELTLLKLSSGARLYNGKTKLLYNLGLVSYQSLFRIPIIEENNRNSDAIDTYNWRNYYLENGYSTFLSFSYQGLSFDNTSIYKKDYNWSSLGIDLIYKKFDLTHFYTKLSFVVSANTIENDINYFNGIDSIAKKEFCLNSKISSITKCIFKDFSSLRLEAYYRNMYNQLHQKEIAVNLGYEFTLNNGIIINPQIGYTVYGISNNWKDFYTFHLSLAYRLF